jgi:hypothetical protein
MVFGRLCKSGLAAFLVLGAAVSSQAAMRDPDSVGFVVGGLNYKYYEGTFTALPNFTTLKPATSDTCFSFDITKVPHRATNFAFVFTGFLNVDFDDDFTFYLKSSDGSQLLIGDSVVVDNNGVHSAAVEKSGKIGLASGKHKITVRYFGTATPSLSVQYEAGSVTRTEIPEGALFRPFTGVIPTITINNPKGGNVYRLGDTVDILWTYTGGKGHTVFLDLSRDNGKTFILIKPTPFTQNTEAGEYKWVVPEADSMITNQALIGINDYIVGGPEGESEIFKIMTKGAGIAPLERKSGAALALDGRIFSYSPSKAGSGAVSLSLVDMKGEAVPLQARASSNAMSWEIPAHVTGLHWAILSVNGIQEVRRLVMFNR